MKEGATQLVIGGGVIGLCSAYFLAKAGYKVTVIDRDPTYRESCSRKNAGMVVPSHFIPLAAPGVITQGLKWMLNPKSPFAFKPRVNLELASWVWQFYRHANQKHVDNSRQLLCDINLESRALFEQLADELGFAFERRGLLTLCRTDAGLHEEAEVAEAANAIGIEAEVCDLKRIQELDPDVQTDVKGGIWFRQDGHMDPAVFLDALRKGIIENGGELQIGEVSAIKQEGNRIHSVVLEDGSEIVADSYTIAGGAWSPTLATHLGVKLPMQAGKGYSFTLENPKQLPKLCYLLKEGRVAVTPMGASLRVAGTMEICGNDLSINVNRLAGIIASFCEFFPAFTAKDFQGLEPWSGLRPCSPDGLPYVGSLEKVSNVVMATGHAMLGLSLAPVTARMVTDIHAGKPADERLAPTRYM